jgi:hypothetical protein
MAMRQGAFVIAARENAGTMESSSGRAIAVPIPLSSVRLGNDLPGIEFSLRAP